MTPIEASRVFSEYVGAAGDVFPHDRGCPEDDTCRCAIHKAVETLCRLPEPDRDRLAQLEETLFECIAHMEDAVPGTAWASRAKAVLDRADEDDRLDALYHRFNRLLVAGRFDVVDEVLARIDPRAMTVTVALAYLSITLPAERVLTERARYFERVRAHLLATEPDRAAELLRGFDKQDRPGAIPPRFSIDHGTVHDRETGRHVRTDPNYGPGKMFLEDGIDECCALLNELHDGVLSWAAMHWGEHERAEEAETRCSAMVSERDLTIGKLRAELERARRDDSPNAPPKGGP